MYNYQEEKIRVLLVEDDVVDQMAFKRLVKNHQLPYDYLIADSVISARRMLREHKFDIIIADFNLGDGNAFEIFDESIDTPYIFVTGSGDEEIAVKAMKKGAHDYLIKDSDRYYLQLIPVTVEQAVRHHKLEISQKEAENKIKMLFHAVEQSSASIVITDPEGNIQYVNPKFEHVTGYKKEEVIGKNPRILKTEYHEKEFYEELWDTILSGKTWTGEFLNQKKNGLNFWELATISPVFDDDGNIIHLIAVKEDVTEQRKVKQALEFRVKFEKLINQISTKFINLTTNKIEDALDESLQKIALFINIDRAFVFRLDENKTSFIRSNNWFSDEIELTDNLPEMLSLNDIPWLYKQLLDLDMVFIPTLLTLPPQAEKEKNLLSSINARSVIFLPMVYEQKLLGFVGLCSVQYEKHWDNDTIKLVKILVEIMVNALQRKRASEEIENLYNSLKQEVDLAASVQTYLVPKWLLLYDQIVFSSVYKPSSSIGGDLFDIHQLSESKFVFYVGDISGHGVKAALMMTGVKSIISMLIESEKENLKPHFIIKRLNKILCRQLFHSDYMTISLGLIDLEKNEIRYINAGHPSIIEYDMNTGKTVVLGDHGSIPVGWDEDFDYREEHEDIVNIQEGKSYILYTDGIFECENPEGNQLGLDGFTTFLEEQANIASGIILPHLFKQRLMDLKYKINSDDFTMLTFQKREQKKQKKYSKLFLVNSLSQNTTEIANECYQAILASTGNDTRATEIELVINEFLNNIIEHGLQEKKDATILLSFEIDKKITMKFIDNGKDWELPKPIEKNIAEPDKFRGMGMQIIYKLVSEIKKNRYDMINETIIEVDVSYE